MKSIFYLLLFPFMFVGVRSSEGRVTSLVVTLLPAATDEMQVRDRWWWWRHGNDVLMRSAVNSSWWRHRNFFRMSWPGRYAKRRSSDRCWREAGDAARRRVDGCQIGVERFQNVSHVFRRFRLSVARSGFGMGRRSVVGFHVVVG